MDHPAIRALGTTPVPGPAPAGAALRYEPQFEQLSAEIEKLSSVEQTPVDWRVVVDLGSGLLKNGKDLLIASYLTYGLLDRGGYAGFASGCVMLRSLQETFWDGLFPELRRLRARIAALDWLANRLEKGLATRGEPSLGDRPGLIEAIGALEGLVDDCKRRYEGEGPNLAPAIRALRGKLDAIPEPRAAEPPPAAAPAAAAPAAATPPPPPPPPPSKPADAASVGKALAEQRLRQLEFAELLRAADDADPRGYALLREALWSDVTTPAADERTASSTGDDAVLAPLQKALADGEFADALANAEALLPKNPLWLDLQLVVVDALDGLGRRYARARQAVLASLAFLLQRCPGLSEGLSDKGKPLASKATRVWLANEVLQASGAADAHAKSDPASEARKLMARGKLSDAMRLLTGRIDATASRRGRFVLRLDLARLCIEAGRLDLAVPQLEQLDKEVTHFSLEEWEPDLATEVVRSLWQCCSANKPPPALAARGPDIYARLCRLDPAAAVSATGPQGE